MQLLEASEGRVRVALPTTEWFCRLYREVAPEIIGVLGDVAGITTIPSIARADERFVVINVTTSFTAPVVPDGRPLVADAIVRHRRGRLVITECEITDADGQASLSRNRAACSSGAWLAPDNERPTGAS
jgi:acyl-coenzyme A thioesterase PaaI-like protein